MLPASPAVALDFFGEGLAGSRLKSLAQEKLRRVSHRKHARNPAPPRFGESKLQQFRACAAPAKRRLDGQRTNLREIRAVVFQRDTTHHALLLFEPLLFDPRPLGKGCQESLVLVRNALAQVFDMRMRSHRLGQLGELFLGTRELHGQQGTLNLEVQVRVTGFACVALRVVN